MFKKFVLMDERFEKKETSYDAYAQISSHFLSSDPAASSLHFSSNGTCRLYFIEKF
jgi:hypothetical protein